MQQRSRLLTALISSLCLLTPPLGASASCWDASLDIAGGSRRDSLSAEVKSYNPPFKLISTDTLNIKQIRVDEIEANFKALLWGGVILKSSGSLGEVIRGRYCENVEDNKGHESTTHADAKSGHTRDFSAGMGYLCSLSRGLKFGPIAGWAYDYQRVEIHNAKSNGKPDKVLNGLNYATRWQGPWLGLEALFSMGCFNVECSYEYHKTHWHAAWTLDGRDIPGVAFSDHRRATHGSSNLGYLDISYRFAKHWEFGVSSTYRYWKIKDGSLEPDGKRSKIGLSSKEVDEVHSASWRSLSAVARVGCYF